MLHAGGGLEAAFLQGAQIPLAAFAPIKHIFHIAHGVGGRTQGQIIAGGGNIAHRYDLAAAAAGNAFHLGVIACHLAGNRHQITGLVLVVHIGHFIAFKGAVFHLIIRAQQLGDVGIHLQRRQDQAAGVNVAIVFVQTARLGTGAVHNAPNGCFTEQKRVRLLHRVKGQRVKHHKAGKALFVFSAPFGIISQGCHALHGPRDHADSAQHHQQDHHKAGKLAAAAALHSYMFFSCHFCHRYFSLSQNLCRADAGPCSSCFLQIELIITQNLCYGKKTDKEFL